MLFPTQGYAINMVFLGARIVHIVLGASVRISISDTIILKQQGWAHTHT